MSYTVFTKLRLWGLLGIVALLFLAFDFISVLEAAPDPAEKAFIAEKAGDWKEAADLWTGLAEAGEAGAALKLGTLYAQGKGVPKNRKTALSFYMQAIDLKNERKARGLPADPIIEAFVAGKQPNFARERERRQRLAFWTGPTSLPKVKPFKDNKNYNSDFQNPYEPLYPEMVKVNSHRDLEALELAVFKGDAAMPVGDGQQPHDDIVTLRQPKALLSRTAMASLLAGAPLGQKEVALNKPERLSDLDTKLKTEAFQKNNNRLKVINMQKVVAKSKIMSPFLPKPKPMHLVKKKIFKEKTLSAKTTDKKDLRFGVQIGSFRSLERAKRAVGQLQKRYSILLEKEDITIKKTALDQKGIYFRLIVADLPKIKARSLCKNLQAHRHSCWVQSSDLL